MSMFKDIPVEVGVIYEGERIRRNDMQVELGGPTVKQKFELAKVKPMNEIEDGKITIIGPDLKDMKEGGAYPFGILIEAAGAKLDAGLEGVLERRIHGYLNYIEGFMHLNQRYDIWIRIGKKSFQKGLTSFETNRQSPLQTYSRVNCQSLRNYKLPSSQTQPNSNEMTPDAITAYESRDAKARGLKDSEVRRHSTVAHSVNHSPQATSVSLHHKDTATAVPSAGSTVKPPQALTLKVQSSQFHAAK